MDELRPFGGGPGMVMMSLWQKRFIMLRLALQAGCVQVPVVYMSPQGKTLNEVAVQQFVAIWRIDLLLVRTL